MTKLRQDIEDAINGNSAENGSDTPDFILAEYLIDCLAAYDKAVSAREKWYGRAEVTEVAEGWYPGLIWWPDAEVSHEQRH